jgi:hypothetical protein
VPALTITNPESGATLALANNPHRISDKQTTQLRKNLGIAASPVQLF